MPVLQSRHVRCAVANHDPLLRLAARCKPPRCCTALSLGRSHYAVGHFLSFVVFQHRRRSDNAVAPSPRLVRVSPPFRVFTRRTLVVTRQRLSWTLVPFSTHQIRRSTHGVQLARLRSGSRVSPPSCRFTPFESQQTIKSLQRSWDCSLRSPFSLRGTHVFRRGEPTCRLSITETPHPLGGRGCNGRGFWALTPAWS